MPKRPVPAFGARDVSVAADTGGMAPIVMWIAVAFVVATLVLLGVLVAGSRSGGVRAFLADLRTDPDKEDDGGPGLLAATRRDMTEAADAESGSVEQLFDIGEPEQVGYLGTGDHPRR